jgi:uncharacterized protein YegP (UPF0339 family)
MATSPRSELRIVTLTEFRLSNDKQWYWHTEAPNGETVGDGGEGYKELRKAIAGFFAQQGFDVTTEDPAQRQYSKLYQENEKVYHIRKYAFGAPDPFDPADPLAPAVEGWQPPDV